jgi:hypothetical protein
VPATALSNFNSNIYLTLRAAASLESLEAEGYDDGSLRHRHEKPARVTHDSRIVRETVKEDSPLWAHYEPCLQQPYPFDRTAGIRYPTLRCCNQIATPPHDISKTPKPKTGHSRKPSSWTSTMLLVMPAVNIPPSFIRQTPCARWPSNRPGIFQSRPFVPLRWQRFLGIRPLLQSILESEKAPPDFQVVRIPAPSRATPCLSCVGRSPARCQDPDFCGHCCRCSIYPRARACSSLGHPALLSTPRVPLRVRQCGSEFGTSLGTELHARETAHCRKKGKLRTALVEPAVEA